MFLRISIYLFLIGNLVAGFFPNQATAQRYQAWLRDGQLVAGEKISGWMTETGGGTLDGRNMFEPANPIRTLRDTAVRIDAVATLVQTTNGDSLPGKLANHDPEKGAYSVALDASSSGPEFDPPQILVNDAFLAGVSRGPATAQLKPGDVELRDGRRFECRAIRVQGQRLQLLTKDGISTAALADVSQLNMPGSRLEDVLADSVWTPPEPPPTPISVLRIRTSGGAQITVPKSLARVIEIDGKKWLYLRPLWAGHTIRILRDRIAWWSFREDSEIPLASLPAQTLKETALISYRPWRRNASIDGLELASGTMCAEYGLGTASYSAIAFDLPPGATEFQAWAGLDRRVGSGGCVKLKLAKDTLDSAPLWESDFLVGGKEPVRIGPLNVAGAKRLVLITDFAHDGRPAGADPLDVRDQVAWLSPIVTIDKAKLPRPQAQIARWLPPLAGWHLTASSADRVRLQTAFDPERREFHLTLNCLDKSKDAAPVELERTASLAPRNTRLVVEASGDGQKKMPAKLGVLVDGEARESTMNGDIDTTPTSFRKPQTREYSLGDLAGKTAKVTLRILHPTKADGDMNGILFWNLALRPLIENLPEESKFATPDISLASLTPQQVLVNGKAQPLPAAGQTSEGKPLEVRGLKLNAGFGLPGGSEVTYMLQPTYDRFIGIIGTTNSSQNVGPFEILIDGQPHWTSGPDPFTRNSPGKFIDVSLPVDAKQITLRIKGSGSNGVWANAGFMKAN